VHGRRRGLHGLYVIFAALSDAVERAGGRRGRWCCLWCGITVDPSEWLSLGLWVKWLLCKWLNYDSSLLGDLPTKLAEFNLFNLPGHPFHKINIQESDNSYTLVILCISVIYTVIAGYSGHCAPQSICAGWPIRRPSWGVLAGGAALYPYWGDSIPACPRSEVYTWYNYYLI